MSDENAKDDKSVIEHKSIRVVTGYSNHPQIYITKELRLLNWKPGDTVMITVTNGKIIIQKVKVDIEF